VPNPLVPRLLLTGGVLGAEPIQSMLFVGSSIEATGPEANRLALTEPTTHLDVSGYVILPAGVEPHAHLDKALLGERVSNPSGDLKGAIAATRSAYPTLTPADVGERARRSLRMAVRRGYTAVRTHVNCEAGIGVEAVRVLIEVRDEVRSTIDLQVFAMAGFPITGADGARNWRFLEEALDAGADGVGGAPALDDNPTGAVVRLVRIAAQHGLKVDLHLDETLDPTSLTVRTFAREVADHGLAGRAVASHCVSLGQLDVERAREIAAELADAGVAVVTLPQTNLYLQGRDDETRVPRGLTAVGVLREAGVTVCAGGDNWRDSFNPVSRIDPLETASLLVATAHLTAQEAYDAVSTSARKAAGFAPGLLAVGSECDVLAVKGADLSDVVADASDDRIVIRRGRVVARTRVLHEIEPDF
jgi:cytosine deaminase